MKLDPKIMNIVLNTGSYYKSNFDIQKKTILLDDKTFDWFLNTLNIQNDRTLFIEFYSFVANPPIGNGSYLLPLDEIIDNEYFTSRLILLGDDELGLLVYEIETDRVYCYAFDAELESSYYLQELRDNYTQKWNSFEEFLADYYA